MGLNLRDIEKKNIVFEASVLVLQVKFCVCQGAVSLSIAGEDLRLSASGIA
jgi:hypothetical protein